MPSGPGCGIAGIVANKAMHNTANTITWSSQNIQYSLRRERP
jgi:hypothetical protein